MPPRRAKTPLPGPIMGDFWAAVVVAVLFGTALGAMGYAYLGHTFCAS